MDPQTQILQKIDEQNQKIDELVQSVKTIKRWFFWIMIATVLTFVLPLIGLLFAIPSFLQTYQTIGNI